MTYNLSLLFDAIAFEVPAGLETIVIAAKRMAFQRQEYPLLMLPDMHQLVNEKPLQANVTIAEIIAKQRILWVEPEMPVGGHGNPPWLKPTIFAIVNPDPVIVERLTEYGLRQRAFARR